jgi:hypothetical protein
LSEGSGGGGGSGGLQNESTALSSSKHNAQHIAFKQTSRLLAWLAREYRVGKEQQQGESSDICAQYCVPADSFDEGANSELFSED